jgi:WD40 repeat protein
MNCMRQLYKQSSDQRQQVRKVLPALFLLASNCVLGAPLHVEVKAQLGHSDAIQSVAFSPDGRQALTGSRDRSAIIWDVQSGRQIRQFVDQQYKSDGIYELDAGEPAVFSPDGRTVLTGNWSGLATLWDTETGREIRHFEGQSGWITTVAFSRDGRSVLIGSDAGAFLGDVATGKLIRRFGPEFVGGAPAVFTRLAGRLFLGSPASLWDIQSGHEIRRFGAGRATTLSADGRYVFGVADYAGLYQWDASTGKEVHHFADFPPATAIAVSPDGRWLAAAHEDKTLRLWDSADGREVRRVAHLENPFRTALVYSPDGRYVLASDGESARLFEADSGWEFRRFESRVSPVYQVEPGLDGLSLAARIYDFERHAEDFERNTETWTIWDFVDGRALRLVPGDAPQSVEQVDTEPENEEATDTLAREHRSVLAYSRNVRMELSQNGGVFSRVVGQGSLILTQDDEGEVDFRDARSGQIVRKVGGDSSLAEAGAFSPDNSRVIIGHRDNTASLVDVATGKELHRLRGHTNWVRSVGFFREGRFVFTSGQDGTIRIWDGESGEPVVTLVAFRDGGWAVLDPKGYYDASIPDAEPGLYGRSGDKTIPVGQLRKQFYMPTLLAKRVGKAAK